MVRHPDRSRRWRGVLPAGLLALSVALTGCGGAVAGVTGSPAGAGGSEPGKAAGDRVTWPLVELPDGRIIYVLCH